MNETDPAFPGWMERRIEAEADEQLVPVGDQILGSAPFLDRDGDFHSEGYPFHASYVQAPH